LAYKYLDKFGLENVHYVDNAHLDQLRTMIWSLVIFAFYEMSERAAGISKKGVKADITRLFDRKF